MYFTWQPYLPASLKPTSLVLTFKPLRLEISKISLVSGSSCRTLCQGPLAGSISHPHQSSILSLPSQLFPSHPFTRVPFPLLSPNSH